PRSYQPHMSLPRRPARKLTIATFANNPQPRPFRSWFRHPPEKTSSGAREPQLDDESAHARSTADIQRLASHEAIGPIAEEYHGPRDIVAAPQPLHRNGGHNRLLALAVLRNNAAEHLGVRDRPGRNHVHGDAGGREFQRPGARHPDHSSLGR